MVNSEAKTINKGALLTAYIEEKKNFGDTVRYQEIEEITGERYGTTKYYQTVAKAKQALLEKGILIQRGGRGEYMVAYPGDFTNAYCREVRLAANRVKRGGKILKNAPTKLMGKDELDTFNRVNDFHLRLSASMAGSVSEARALTRKDHPLLHSVSSGGR